MGHRFGPEVDIERTWSKFGPFHVAYLVRTGRVQNLAYLQERPPRRAPRCIHRANWRDLGVSWNPPRQLANLGVSKDLGVSKTHPTDWSA